MNCLLFQPNVEWQWSNEHVSTELQSDVPATITLSKSLPNRGCCLRDCRRCWCFGQLYLSFECVAAAPRQRYAILHHIPVYVISHKMTSRTAARSHEPASTVRPLLHEHPVMHSLLKRGHHPPSAHIHTRLGGGREAETETNNSQ